MNRSDVVRMTATDLDMRDADVDRILMTVLDNISVLLGVGEDVTFRSFGKWSPRQRRAILRTNPKTGDAMKIPDRVGLVFIPSATLRQILNPGEDLDAER
jgi:nucleoid DNA-binding protein